MRKFTLRERDTLSIGVNKELSEGEAAAFARLEPLLPRGSLIWQHQAIRFGPFCGVLRAGNVTIELIPKIDDRNSRDDMDRGCLVSMLRATGNLVASSAGEASLGHQHMHLLDQFILDFCSRVTARLHGGAIASYEDREENLKILRGRLNLTGNVRHNPGNQQRLYCNFSERSIDNLHNRVLKSVVSILRRHAIGQEANAYITTLLHRFDDIASSVVTVSDIERLTFDRMTIGWEPIFERAKWLLKGLFPDVRNGEVDGTCLLFNMERLFEGYLGARLRQAWQISSGGRFQVSLQGPQKSLSRTGAGQAFNLRPDVAVLRHGSVIVIFDAKWKSLDRNASASGVSSSDIYQLAAYAGRYDCKKVALVYPASSKCPAGLIENHTLVIPNAPVVEVHAVNLRELCSGAALPPELLPLPVL